MLRRPLVLFTELLLIAAVLGSLGLALPREGPVQAAGSPLPEDAQKSAYRLEAPSPTGTLSAATLNCRYGLAAWDPALSAVRPDLWWGLGWYLTFSASGTAVGGMEFLRMVSTKQDKYWNGSTWVFLGTYKVTPPLNDDPSGLGALVHAHPGSWWAIGNEPDRGPDPCPGCPGQDAIFPDLYAQAYHTVYHFIRERDPSARIGPGGLVQVTPGRLQYLDRVWQGYQARYGVSMPLDFWTFHVYILPEINRYGQGSSAGIALGTDPALAMRESDGKRTLCHNPNNNVYCWADHDDLTLFDQQVRRMRQWMKEHGLQDKPLWLTEYSILHPFEDYDDPVHPTRCWLQDEFGKCFTPARVTQWLNQTFAYLESTTDPVLGNPADRYRLVQRWAWFSLRVDTSTAGYVSNIVTGTYYAMTPVGESFRQEVLGHPARVNLLAYQASPEIAYSDPSGVVTVTFSFRVANNGDVTLAAPVTVTWYADESLSVPLASTTLSGLPGCATSALVTATGVLTEGAGAVPYWVKVDATDALPEFDEADNVAQSVVLIDPVQAYLPLIMRRGP